MLCRRSSSTLLVAVLAIGMASIVTAMPPWYNCTSTNCKPPACMCASNSAPGGLAPADTPQFILLTHDDAINALSDKVMRAVTNGRVNPNGCNMPATWYTLQQGTDCATAKKLWNDNHEISLHSVNHAALIPNFGPGLREEMMGVREFLNQTCGLPLDELLGYRVPYLVHNAGVRTIMKEEGLLYDSSMISVFQADSLVETKPGERVWPFTMDHGIPIDCNWNFPDGQCNGTTERYPGVWEVPLWELQNSTGGHLYTMDPEGDVLSLLQENFLMNYENNRAPFGIFLHATWFDGPKTDALNQFFDWALAKPNVWAVTTSQLIRWMQNPVPAANMSTWLTCRPVNLTTFGGEARCQLYKIQEGDSSYNIATKFGVVTADLLAANPQVGDGDSLTVGEQLKIPPFDDTCVGDAVKNVTGPGQIPLTPMPPSASQGGARAPSSGTGTGSSFGSPTSGIDITMQLAGRTQIAFVTDLKYPFESAVARALGVDPKAVSLKNATPLLPASPPTIPTDANEIPKPEVEVMLRVAGPDPLGLYANATASLAPGGTFDTEALPPYQLEVSAVPVIVAYRNDQPLSTTKDGQPVDDAVASAPAASSGARGTIHIALTLVVPLLMTVGCL